tara:strand:+ start:104 stop:328 length:225 start_codon:yes stop_codon:yes gene_type:complete
MHTMNHNKIAYVLGLTMFILSMILLGVLVVALDNPPTDAGGRLGFLLEYPWFPALTAFAGMVLMLTSIVKGGEA